MAFILYVTWEWLTVENYLVELCQDGTRDPIGCTLIEYQSGVVATVQNFHRHQFRETSLRTWSAKYVSKAYKRLELVIQSYLALRLNYVTHTLK